MMVLIVDKVKENPILDGGLWPGVGDCVEEEDGFAPHLQIQSMFCSTKKTLGSHLCTWLMLLEHASVIASCGNVLVVLMCPSH